MLRWRGGRIGYSTLVMVMALVGTALGCGRGSGSATLGSGGALSGGVQSQGGNQVDAPASVGGSVGSGGVSSTGGKGGAIINGTGGTDSGGMPATGGVLATGGQSAAGGMLSLGGAIGTGGAGSGGTQATGGVLTGGRPATGGIQSLGGVALGGSLATGGSAAGGATGGSRTSIDASSSGGTPGTGGLMTGGSQASGGIPGSGGSNSTGGTTTDTSLTWDFATDTMGWLGGFADYLPGGDPYNLQYGWSALPTEVGPGGGLRITGTNLSDDLFMYVTSKVTGLAASTTYQLDVSVVIDSNASSDCIGGGGPPGTGVAFKIGAVAVQPATTVDALGWLRMNLDKDSLGLAGGADMSTVGDIGNTLPCPSPGYQPKTLTRSGFSATTSTDGSLWLILGTDSGFEGTTTLYYDRIVATLRRGH